jgi:hypothetical protein
MEIPLLLNSQNMDDIGCVRVKLKFFPMVDGLSMEVQYLMPTK